MMNWILTMTVCFLVCASYGATPSLPAPIAKAPTATPDAQTITFLTGARQTFNPSATNAGVNVGTLAGDPSSLVNGDLWYSSTAGRLRSRVAGASVDVANGAQFDVAVGTVTSSSAIAIDLSGRQYQTCTLTHDTTLTTANRPTGVGRQSTVFFLASGATRTITINGSWKNYGTNSLVVASGKEAFVTVMALGPAETDVRVVSGVTQ